MVRLLIATVSVILASAIFANSAAAAECGLCLDSVALQTPDGQPWTEGKPVTLVVHITSQAAVALPPKAVAIVMQTDGDRTKCLDVPLKLVQGDAGGGVYAGLFFPFRPARYDGKVTIGDEVHPIAFDVKKMAAGAGPAGDLPAAQRIDTARAPGLFQASWLPAAGAGALGFLALAAVVLYAGRRRSAPPRVM